MMKKSVLFVTCIFIFVCIGCEKNEITPSTKAELAVADCFELVHNEERNEYEYTIMNYKGEILIREKVEWRAPTITCVDDDIIEVLRGAGTYVFACQYFNVKTSAVSDIFQTPFFVDSGIIAYYEGAQLVVRDIFNEDLFCKKFYVDMILTGPPNTVEWVKGRNALEIEYMRGVDCEIETRIFDLEDGTMELVM